jgi:hypothetical protein
MLDAGARVGNWAGREKRELGVWGWRDTDGWDWGLGFGTGLLRGSIVGST